MTKQMIEKRAAEMGFKLRVDTLPRDKRAEYVFTHPSRPDRFWAYIDASVANAFLEGWAGGLVTQFGAVVAMPSIAKNVVPLFGS